MRKKEIKCYDLDIFKKLSALRSDIYQVIDALGSDLPKKETKQLKKVIEVSSEIENNISIINNSFDNANITFGGIRITAPLPSNVLVVYAHKGEMVEKGQRLLILECMKMEREILSPVKGKIESLFVSKDMVVDQGDVLCTLVPIE